MYDRVKMPRVMGIGVTTLMFIAMAAAPPAHPQTTTTASEGSPEPTSVRTTESPDTSAGAAPGAVTMTADTWPRAVRGGTSVRYTVRWANNTNVPQSVQFKADLHCFAEAAKEHPGHFDIGDDTWSSHVIPPKGGTITKKIWVPSKCLPPNQFYLDQGYFTGGGFFWQKVGGVEGAKGVNFNVVY